MNCPLSGRGSWGHARTLHMAQFMQWSSDAKVWVSTNTCKCTLAIMGEKELVKKQVAATLSRA